MNTIEGIVELYPDDCILSEHIICPSCGCDLWDVYYIFGNYKCDNCIDTSTYTGL